MIPIVLTPAPTRLDLSVWLTRGGGRTSQYGDAGRVKNRIRSLRWDWVRRGSGQWV